MATLQPDPSGAAGGLVGKLVDGIYYGGVGGTSAVPVGGTWDGSNKTYFTPAGILLQQNSLTVRNATFTNPYNTTLFPTAVSNGSAGRGPYTMTFPAANFSPANPDGGFGNFQIDQVVNGPGISKPATGTVYVTHINTSTHTITLDPTGGATVALEAGQGYAFQWTAKHTGQEAQIQPLVRTIPVSVADPLTGITLNNITALGYGIGTYQAQLVGCAGFDILSTDSVTLTNCQAINTCGDSLTTFMRNPGGYPYCTNLVINNFTSTNPGREGWTCSTVNGGVVNGFTSVSGGEHDLDFESDLAGTGSGNMVINNFVGDTGIQFNEAMCGPITFNEAELGIGSSVGAYFTITYEAAGRGPYPTFLITLNNSKIEERYHSSGTPPASIFVSQNAPPYNTTQGGQLQLNGCTLTRNSGTVDESPAWIVEDYSSIQLCTTTFKGPVGEADSTSTSTIGGSGCLPPPPAPPVFTSANHSTFTEFITKHFTFTATGAPTITFALVSGTLPTGLTFANGVISGAAQEFGVYDLVVSATNTGGTVNQNFTLTVNESTGLPTFTSSSSTTFTQNAYNEWLVQTVGAPTPALFLIGQLPDGLSFVDNGDGSGTLSGVPSTSGTFGFSFVATNVVGSATQLFSLTIQGENFNMQLTKGGYFGWASGGKNGALVDMWAADRFSTPPAMNAAPPDGNPPDAGPVTTGIDFGGPGAYDLVVPSVQDYYQRVQYGGNAYWGLVPAGTLAGQPQFTGSAGVISSLDYFASTAYIVTATTLTAIDTVNLVLPDFIVPASGNVRVQWSAYLQDPTPVGTNFGVVFEGSGSINNQDMTRSVGDPLSARCFFDGTLTGATVGDSYTLQLAALVHSGSAQIGNFGDITAYVTAL